MTDNSNLKCSGYGVDKHKAIKKCNIDWDGLVTYHWLDHNWLCTHAGLSNTFFKQQQQQQQQCTKKLESIQQILNNSKTDLKKINDEDYTHSFFQIGFYRGGTNMIGGPLWCDYREFVDIPNINQVFGHTPNQIVRSGKTDSSEHYCIDTGLDHYAVYQDGVMQIKSR